MLRRFRYWIIGIVTEALESEFRTINARQSFILNEVNRIYGLLTEIDTRLKNREIEDHIRDQFEAERRRSEEARAKLDSSAQPLAQSRASWPRMKKHFEENDVKNVVAAQRSAEEEFIGTARRQDQTQSERLEHYWREKQLQESLHQGSTSDSQEKGN